MAQQELAERVRLAAEQVSAGLPLRQETVDALREAAAQAFAGLDDAGRELFGLVHAIADRMASRGHCAAMLGTHEGLMDAAMRASLDAGPLSHAFGRPYWDARIAAGERGDAPTGT